MFCAPHFVLPVPPLAELTEEEKRIMQASEEARKMVMQFHMVPGTVTSKQFVQSPALATAVTGDHGVNSKVQLTVYQNKVGGLVV